MRCTIAKPTPAYMRDLETIETEAAASAARFAAGEGAAWAFGWFTEGVASESYVNLIPTVAGGTHESGLRAGVFEAMKTFVEHHALLPRGVKLQQEDVCGKMGFVLSARLLDPQFQGQVKEKLNSREAVKLVSSQVKDPFEIWLNLHVEAGKAIAELAIKQALAEADGTVAQAEARNQEHGKADRRQDVGGTGAINRTCCIGSNADICSRRPGSWRCAIGHRVGQSPRGARLVDRDPLTCDNRGCQTIDAVDSADRQ